MKFENVYDLANYLKKNRVIGFSIDIKPPFVIVSSYYFGLGDVALFSRLLDCENLVFRIDAKDNYCRAVFKLFEK